MIKDLRSKSSDELKLLIVQLRSQLMENRFKVAQGEGEKTHLIKEMRRLVAQTMTVLHERNEAMQTADWHKFHKVMIEEQNKKVSSASEAVPNEKTNLLDKFKSGIKKMKLSKKENDTSVANQGASK